MDNALKDLAEKFRRLADRAHASEDYDVSDVWRDAAAYVEEAQNATATSEDNIDTHWEVKYLDWYNNWISYSHSDVISTQERAKEVFEGYDEDARLYRVEKHLVDQK